MTHEEVSAKAFSLVIDGQRGLYVPQAFVVEFSPSEVDGMDDQDSIDSLLAGPNDELYWDSWEYVLENYCRIGDNSHEYRLIQSNGDLFEFDSTLIDAWEIVNSESFWDSWE